MLNDTSFQNFIFFCNFFYHYLGISIEVIFANNFHFTVHFSVSNWIGVYLVAVQSLVACNQFYSDDREQLQSRFEYPWGKMRYSHHFMSAIGFSWTLVYFYVFLLNSVRSKEYCIDNENQFCTLLKEYAKGNFLNILYWMLYYIFNTISFICFAFVFYCLIIIPT